MGYLGARPRACLFLELVPSLVGLQVGIQRSTVAPCWGPPIPKTDQCLIWPNIFFGYAAGRQRRGGVQGGGQVVLGVLQMSALLEKKAPQAVSFLGGKEHRSSLVSLFVGDQKPVGHLSLRGKPEGMDGDLIICASKGTAENLDTISRET